MWGAGIPAGVDAYDLFLNRADPGTTRPSFSDTSIIQPLHNADIGNVAVTLLGLPPIPGAPLLPTFGTKLVRPSLAVDRTPAGFVVSWPVSAASYELQASPALLTGANWQPVTNTSTTVDGRIVCPITITPDKPIRFFRLMKP
jgi:hypothetical protein